MDLTIIILNFNVRYLLESCLESVLKAIHSIPSEVLVVDNASTDESVAMIRSRFPQVIILANQENLGFAKANNLAIAQAKGKIILILNPDTLVHEMAIKTGLDYLNQHDEVAAIGVKMTDGKGKFLEESKRGFPTLWSSWWKLTGINRWFTKHGKLNHYYLGHLDEDEIHEVEVLTGAFFMVKQRILEQTGGFDEGYYMYGEDIDLSHRIRELGFRLVYLGTQSIVHLKGRSSSAYSYQHIRNFYQAMLVFVNKYYRQPVTRFIMKAGIWLTGLFSWIKRKIFFHFLPLADLILISVSIYFIQFLWARFWFENDSYFQHITFFWNALGYVIIWSLTLISSGAYRIQQSSPGYLAFKAIIAGTGIILVIYSLLPEPWRTSRAIILLSGLQLCWLLPLSRILLKPHGFGFRALLFGDQQAEVKLNALFRALSFKNYFAYISRLEPPEPEKALNIKIAKLNEAVTTQHITHVILPRTRSWKTDLLQLTQKGTGTIIFMLEDLEGSEGLSRPSPIPGLIEVNIRLNSPFYRYIKIIVNVLFSILILPWGWLISDVRRNFINLVTGKKQWVSYRSPADEHLPRQKPGIWQPDSGFELEKDKIKEVNFEYAKNYHPFHDTRIILANLFKLS